MKTTPLREYPYPECEPPLVKDASDIIQLRDLAMAIDADVENLTVESTPMIYPVASKMRMPSLVTSQQEFVVTYTTNSWQTRVGMNDTTLGSIVIPETGFYQVHIWAACNSTTSADIRTRLIVNDVDRGTWGGYSAAVTGVTLQSAVHDVSLFLNEGDRLTSRIRHSLGASSTYQSNLHVVQLARS